MSVAPGLEGKKERLALKASAAAGDDHLVAGGKETQIAIKPYILAGGRSTRMGSDKAAMFLGGRSLLRRAVDTVREVPTLRDANGRVVATILGDRTELEGADRAVRDHYAGCGPLGGMEAALCDLQQSDEAEWAFFMPVDMPFLTSSLIDALLREWIAASAGGACICHVVVDGRPQPLVSLINRMLRPFLTEALTEERFGVTQVLHAAADALPEIPGGGVGSCLYRTYTGEAATSTLEADLARTEEHPQLQRVWFSNVNCERDLMEAETFITNMGSIR